MLLGIGRACAPATTSPPLRHAQPAVGGSACSPGQLSVLVDLDTGLALDTRPLHGVAKLGASKECFSLGHVRKAVDDQQIVGVILRSVDALVGHAARILDVRKPVVDLAPAS